MRRILPDKLPGELFEEGRYISKSVPRGELIEKGSFQVGVIRGNTVFEWLGNSV